MTRHWNLESPMGRVRRVVKQEQAGVLAPQAFGLSS